jgi:hypothetical protein
MATQYKPNPTRAELRKEAATEEVAPPKGGARKPVELFKEGITPPKDDEGPVKPVKRAKGGKVKSASARADGCCIRGKTRA